MIFSFTPFVTQIGIQYWFLAGALHGVACRYGDRGRMSRWLLASGDFTHAGRHGSREPRAGAYLAASRREVHLVAHRVAADLAALPGVTCTTCRGRSARTCSARRCWRAAAARRRARSAPRRAHAGERRQRALARADVGPLPARRVRAPGRRPTLRSRVSASLGRRRTTWRASAQRRARRAASSATAAGRRRTCAATTASRDSRLRVVYYGVDPARLRRRDRRPERRAARTALSSPADRRAALFIGALGDRRKGFDALFDAWRRSRRTRRGTSICWWRAPAPSARRGSGAPRTPGWPGRVRFLGFRGDVARVLAARRRPRASRALRGVRTGRARGDLPRRAGDRHRCRRRRRAVYRRDARPLIERTCRCRGRSLRRCAAGARTLTRGRARFEPPAASLRTRSWDAMAAEIADAGRGGRMTATLTPVSACWVCGGTEFAARPRRAPRVRRLPDPGSGAGRIFRAARPDRALPRLRLRAAREPPGAAALLRPHVRPALVGRLDRSASTTRPTRIGSSTTS